MSKEVISVQIGKNGITEGLIEEIKIHLKTQKDVRLRFLTAFIADKDRKMVSEEIQKKLNKKGKAIGNTLFFRGNHG